MDELSKRRGLRNEVPFVLHQSPESFPGFDIQAHRRYFIQSLFNELPDEKTEVFILFPDRQLRPNESAFLKVDTMDLAQLSANLFIKTGSDRFVAEDLV